MTRRGRTLLVALAFAGLTAVMTWPQARFLASRAPEHQDVFFNLWRLRWVAHAIASSPTHLFDANIFYPEPRTLTFSDAMLVEGVAAAPLLWAGVPPVLVHNLLLLGAIVASAVGMFVLVRDRTGSVPGGVLAGIAFAFAPYRFEHFMHMEMQWTMWMPWAFWALIRTIERGAIRDGLLTGLFVVLQTLSSIYYGLFLIALLPVFGLLLLLGRPRRRAGRALGALAAGGLFAAIVCGAYAIPYRQTQSELGGRSPNEVVSFSARPSSYLIATPDNVVWGRALASRGRPERRLFPGATVLVLALVGLLLKPPPPVALACLVGIVLAFDLSLGLSGHLYPVLSEYVSPYRGLRALARLGIFVVFFVAWLGAYGYEALAGGASPRTRRIVAVTLGVLMLAEYRVRPLPLVPYTSTAPPLYRWLAAQPPGVVAEMPMPAREPGNDPRYTYLSTFHWKPIVNGYSGYYPPSYLDRLKATRGFPDEASIRRLRGDGVRYLIVHLDGLPPPQRGTLLHTLAVDRHLVDLGRFDDGRGEAAVFSLPH